MWSRRSARSLNPAGPLEARAGSADISHPEDMNTLDILGNQTATVGIVGLGYVGLRLSP